jgi:hypothetical protein
MHMCDMGVLCAGGGVSAGSRPQLTELSIASRLMRKDNYFIAMINQVRRW